MRLKERLMMKLTINATLRMVMVMLTGVGMASLVSAVPASAQNVVIDLGKTILGIEDEKPELDYRPRPPR